MSTSSEAWWETQDIIWLGGESENRTEQFNNWLASADPYVVREVQLYEYQPWITWTDEGFMNRDYNPSVADAWRLIERTEEEFRLLERCGIAVASTDWHVFEASERTKVLARTAIIDGIHLNNPANYASRDIENTIEQLKRSIAQYINSTEAGDRLCDISGLNQYVYGKPRQENQGQDRAYLVDIEPIY